MTLEPPSENDIVITFGVEDDTEETDSDVVRLDRVAGLDATALRKIEQITGASAHVRAGDVGVDASGPGIELWLTFASVPDDIFALAEIGQGIRRVIAKVRRHRDRTVVISHGPTFAALAAASLPPDVAHQFDGMTFSSCRNLSGAEPPNWTGTDDRHIWVAMFQHPTSGLAGFVFMAPSGERLGQVVVPYRVYWDGDEWRRRTSEELDRSRPTG